MWVWLPDDAFVLCSCLDKEQPHALEYRGPEREPEDAVSESEV